MFRVDSSSEPSPKSRKQPNFTPCRLFLLIFLEIEHGREGSPDAVRIIILKQGNIYLFILYLFVARVERFPALVYLPTR